MINIKVDNANGLALDYLVALSTGFIEEFCPPRLTDGQRLYWITRSVPLYSHSSNPTTQSINIIEKMGCILECQDEEVEPDRRKKWRCAAPSRQDGFDHPCAAYGPTMMIAAMRCYVKTMLGEYADIPEDFYDPK